MKWANYSKTTYLKHYRISAEVYAKRKMNVEMLKCKSNLRKSTPDGRISWCFFDKESFDKKLSKKIKKMFGKDVNLNRLWEQVIAESDLYIQQDFLEDIYGHKFRVFGDFRDYGLVIFYTDNEVTNNYRGKELLETWFGTVVIANYRKERKHYDKYNFFSKGSFELKQRWKPICDAIMYFDKTISMDEIKKHVLVLAKLERLSIKTINDYQIIFE